MYTEGGEGQTKVKKGGRNMRKEEEKKPLPWEAGDPKLPVVRSGHLEDRAKFGNGPENIVM